MSQKNSTRHYEYITTNPDVHHPEILNEYQSYLLDDRLMESDDSDSEKEQKQEIEIIFSSTKQTKEEREKAMILLKKAKENKIHESTHNRVSRQITVLANRNLNTKTQSLSYFDQYIFAPEGFFKIVWDLQCMLLILYEIVSIPLLISFDIEISDAFDIYLDVIFLSDILLNFNTAFYKNGIPNYNRKSIVQNYFKFWFWMDLVASFPYSRVIEYQMQQDDKEFLQFLRFVRLIRIVRLLRLAKLKILLDKLEEQIQLSTTFAFVVSFLKLSYFVLFWSHWLGCIFHFIGTDQPDSWLEVYGLTHEPWYIRYITSLYWAVTTMNTVGYGDISPQTTNERVYGVFFLLLATGVFSFTLNTIGSALQQIQDKRDEYRRKMQRVRSYMKSVNIPNFLENKVKRYLSYIWDSEHPVNLHIITDNLNESLKQEFTLSVNGGVLASCEFFVDIFSNLFLVEVSMIVKEMTIYPDEYVFHEDEDRYIPKNLFFISEGQIQIISKQCQILKLLQRGDYFGEIGFFGDCPRTASAKSKYFADLFYIEREEFHQKIQNHTKDYVCLELIHNFLQQKWMQVKDDINLCKEYHQLNISCYACNRDDHVVRDCPSLHFTIEPVLLVEVIEKCQTYLMKNFKRKDKVYFHSLQQLKLIKNEARRFKQGTMIEDQKKEFDVQEDDEQSIRDIKESIYRFNNRFRGEKLNKVYLKRFMRNSKLRVEKMLQMQEKSEQILARIGQQVQNRNLNLSQLRKETKDFYKRNRTIFRKQIYQLHNEMDEVEQSLDSNDSENSEVKRIDEQRMNQLKLKYFQQNIQTLKGLNHENLSFRQRQQYDDIVGFEKMGRFQYYYPHNNIENVLQEYTSIYHNQQQLRPTENREFDDEVQRELMNYLGITFENEQLQKMITKNCECQVQFNSYQRQKKKRQIVRNQQRNSNLDSIL